MMGDYEDVLGAAVAVAALEDRIRELRARLASPPAQPNAVLTPPLSDRRDHVDGPESASLQIVVFGAYGTPASRALGQLLDRLRAARPAELRIAWRHLPDPDAHPRATALALAAEAAASDARFWSMSRELLALRHYDLAGVQHAARRADVDFDRLLSVMRAGVGADRVVDDVASGLASSVVHAPTLFINGERFNGELDAEAVWAAVQAAVLA
jgi:NhaA family Na+:H+ antiporter